MHAEIYNETEEAQAFSLSTNMKKYLIIKYTIKP